MCKRDRRAVVASYYTSKMSHDEKTPRVSTLQGGSDTVPLHLISFSLQSAFNQTQPHEDPHQTDRCMNRIEQTLFVIVH